MPQHKPASVRIRARPSTGSEHCQKGACPDFEHVFEHTQGAAVVAKPCGIPSLIDRCGLPFCDHHHNCQQHATRPQPAQNICASAMMWSDRSNRLKASGALLGRLRGRSARVRHNKAMRCVCVDDEMANWMGSAGGGRPLRRASAGVAAIRSLCAYVCACFCECL